MLIPFRNKSGAAIKIADETGGSGERIVTISGNPEAVGMAQFLIKTRCALCCSVCYFSSGFLVLIPWFR